MMNFKYYIPTRILFGTGSLQQLGDQELPGKRYRYLVKRQFESPRIIPGRSGNIFPGICKLFHIRRIGTD